MWYIKIKKKKCIYALLSIYEYIYYSRARTNITSFYVMHWFMIGRDVFYFVFITYEK